jgi:septum formation protein
VSIFNRRSQISNPKSSSFVHLSHLKLVLASRSPQRVQLMRDAGLLFDIIPADIDETLYPAALKPPAIAQYLALEKARCIADKIAEKKQIDHYVIGADTIVVVGDIMLGKPTDAADARRMLQLMSNTTQHVITGLAIINQSRQIQHVEHVVSDVTMRALTDADIARHLEFNLWHGKAGGYGIQDMTASPDNNISRINDGADTSFITCINGPFSNVVGLPIERLLQLLNQFAAENKDTA